MDKEVIDQARRHAAVLQSVGLPRAAAETEAAYPFFSSPDDTFSEDDDETPAPAA